MDYARLSNVYDTVEVKCSKTSGNVWLVFSILVCSILIAFSFLLTPKLVVGNSMYPTLNTIEKTSDVVYIVEQKNYRRGDIVVLRKNDTQSSSDAIKRLIGLSGEKISIKQDIDGLYKVFINDVPYEENYISNAEAMEKCYYNFRSYLLNNDYTTDYLILGEGEIFVLGDNRANSLDSSNYGARHTDEIEGRVMLVIPQHYNFAKIRIIW